MIYFRNDGFVIVLSALTEFGLLLGRCCYNSRIVWLKGVGHRMALFLDLLSSGYLVILPFLNSHLITHYVLHHSLDFIGLEITFITYHYAHEFAEQIISEYLESAIIVVFFDRL